MPAKILDGVALAEASRADTKRRTEALRRYLAGELTPPRPVGALRLMLEMARGALALARVPEGG